MVDTILKEMSRVSPGCIPRWGGHRLRYNIGLVVAGFLAFACYVGVVAWGDSIGAIPNAEINFFTTAFQAGWLSIYDGGGEHLLFSRSSF